jgi:hypothetical protein
VSFDVAVEASGWGFMVAPPVHAELVAGSQLYLKLGCDDEACSRWAGERGVSMFEATGWLPNPDPAHAYASISATLFDLGGAQSTDRDHVALTVHAPAAIDSEEARTSPASAPRPPLPHSTRAPAHTSLHTRTQAAPALTAPRARRATCWALCWRR